MLIVHNRLVNGILYVKKSEIFEVTEELEKGDTRILHKIERLAAKNDKTEEEKVRLKRMQST